jgi:ABC-type sulfate transport system substrate-binding protein
MEGSIFQVSLSPIRLLLKKVVNKFSLQQQQRKEKELLLTETHQSTILQSQLLINQLRKDIMYALYEQRT